VSASDRGPEWAGHLLSLILFSEMDSVDCYVFPVESKSSQLPDLILSGEGRPIHYITRCGNDAENSVKGRRFLPPSHGYAVLSDKLLTLFRSACDARTNNCRSLSLKTLSQMSSAPHKRLTCPKSKYRFVRTAGSRSCDHANAGYSFRYYISVV
jgi:hypothetical protein